jgi:hypothetical protein
MRSFARARRTDLPLIPLGGSAMTVTPGHRVVDRFTHARADVSYGRSLLRERTTLM